MQMNVSIVVAVFNQIEHTRRCLDGMAAERSAGARLIVVDNGSTDGTAEFLAGQPEILMVRNAGNAGCARAWNQGVKKAEGDWVVVLNNDVILTEGWLEGLLEFARQKPADIVCPALREGVLNYDLPAHARGFVSRMTDVARPGAAHGVCFLVRRPVFQTIGLFDENFKFGVFEDTDFFLRAKQALFSTAITGASFIHHFKSVTQSAILKEGVPPYEEGNRVYFRKKWGLNWWRRKRRQVASIIRSSHWRHRELRRGHVLWERWKRGKWTHH
jgi:GT2 family glycosyltransferase